MCCFLWNCNCYLRRWLQDGLFLCATYVLCYIIHDTSYKIYLYLRNLTSCVCWLSRCVCWLSSCVRWLIPLARGTLVHRNSYAVIFYACKSSLELRFAQLQPTKLKEDNTVSFLLNTLHVTQCMSRIACYNTLHVTHCMLHVGPKKLSQTVTSTCI